MSLVKSIVIREVRVIKGANKTKAIAYIQQQVDSYAMKHRGQWFSAQNIFGGKNRNWGGTPIQCLYDYYRNVRHYPDQKAQSCAGMTLGWLMACAIDQSSQLYDTRDAYTRQYRLL